MTQMLRRPRFDPWVRKIPWRRQWQPTPVFLPGKSHGRRSLAGYMELQRVEHDRATSLSFFFFLLVMSHDQFPGFHVILQIAASGRSWVKDAWASQYYFCNFLCVYNYVKIKRKQKTENKIYTHGKFLVNQSTWCFSNFVSEAVISFGCGPDEAVGSGRAHRVWRRPTFNAQPWEPHPMGGAQALSL